MALLITLFLGMFFIAGGLFAKYYKNGELIEHISIAVALGAMLGIGMLDIMPEIFEIVTPQIAYVPIIGCMVGFILLVILDRFIPEHEEVEELEYDDDSMAHIGVISSVAIVLHNIIEGMAVYSLANNSIKQGFMLMLGVGLHNIPMGMFIYSTLKGGTKAKRLLFMGISAVSTFIGGIIMMCISSSFSETFDCALFGIALGMLIYIVVLELLPFVKRAHNKKTSTIGIVTGLLIVLISTFLE